MRRVNDSSSMAESAVRLYVIDVVESEGALMAWLPAERFLWASDDIQDLRAPRQYVCEVYQATRRVGIAPEQVGAQHIPLTAWRTFEALAIR